MKVYSYRIKIDKSLQEDVQVNPFINSKNKQNNSKVIDHLKSNHLEVREYDYKANNNIINWIDNIDDNYFDLEFFKKKIKDLELESIINIKMIKNAMLDFNWKFEKFNFNRKKILSLGSGDGMELFFLRFKFPNAEIYAVDWVNKINPKILSSLKVKFETQNIYDYLIKNANSFDLIYSSHVLEHSYEIDYLLNLINKSLVIDGILASNLPLCSFYGIPYYNFLNESLQNKNINQVDGGLIDLGHPWKTNEYDLYSTLKQSNFDNINIYCNSNQIVRMKRVKMNKFLSNANLKYNLNFLLIKPFKVIIQSLFGNNINYWVLKFFNRLVRSIPISDNKVAHYTPETLFIAKKKI